MKLRIKINSRKRKIYREREKKNFAARENRKRNMEYGKREEKKQNSRIDLRMYLCLFNKLQILICKLLSQMFPYKSGIISYSLKSG